MNELMNLDFQGHTVRSIKRDDQVWWVLSDVCKVLNLSSPHKVADRLDDDEKDRNLIPTQGGAQKMTIVNEVGLYSVILKSDKPEAKVFKRWVTHEVLPSIHQHGIYVTPDTLHNMAEDPNLADELIDKLIKQQERELNLTRKLKEYMPKVQLANAITASKTMILVREMAKILKQNGIDIGQNRLYQYLRTNGYLISNRGTDYNMPTQKSMELGLFFVKEKPRTNQYGDTYIERTSMVTPKGQEYFVNHFMSKKKHLQSYNEPLILQPC